MSNNVNISLRGETLGLAYLCTPYSHPDAEIREKRYREAALAAIELTKLGYAIHSPIVHWHTAAKLDEEWKGDPKFWEADYWWPINQLIIDKSDVVILVAFDGWMTSYGVTQERSYAVQQNKKFLLFTPEELGINE